MSFAEELKRWRKRIGKTQVEAAQLVKTKPTTYTSWEQGRATPDEYKRVAIQIFIRSSKNGDK